MPDDRLPKPDERPPKPDDRRRAFRSVLTYASPHAADVPLLRRWVPPASLPGSGSSTGGDARPPRCARGVRCARARGAAPRAARGGGGPLAPPGAARLRRADADVPAAVAGVGCCALRTRELHGRRARLPRCTRGDAWAPRHGLGARGAHLKARPEGVTGTGVQRPQGATRTSPGCLPGTRATFQCNLHAPASSWCCAG